MMANYDANDAVKLGAYMQELRSKQHMTGAELGELVGLSQSKISKIEHGQQPLVSTEMLAKMLDALQASSAEKHRANLLAAKADIPTETVEVFHFSHQQGQHLELQENAQQIWQFTANIIPLLLQAPNYRIAQLKRMGLEAQQLSDNMQETVKRQDLIWNINQKYHIFCPESTLYTRPSTTLDQLAQLDRLERMLDLENCTIGIIPLELGSSFYPLPACLLYDKKVILYEVGTRDLISKNEEDIALALKTFKQLEEISFTGKDAKVLIRRAAEYFQSEKTRFKLF